MTVSKVMKPTTFRSPYTALTMRKKLASKLGVPTSAITQILRRKAGAGYELAMRLERELNIPREVWFNWKESRHRVYLTRSLRSKAKKEPKSFWGDRGHKADVARAVGILPASLSNIIHRRARASWRVAQRLQRVTAIPSCYWMDSVTSTHPAFYGKPLLNQSRWVECPEIGYPHADARKPEVVRKPSRVI